MWNKVRRKREVKEEEGREERAVAVSRLSMLSDGAVHAP